MNNKQPVAYSNGRLILRSVSPHTATYISTYMISGITYRADAVVYDNEGEWKIIVSVQNMDNGAEVMVKTQTALGYSDAAKRAIRFCANAKNTGEGVEI